MDRVYLLLRNNQQTGPFTIGELLQQQLKSSDMIWIEGKSTAWTYLSELELSPFPKHAEVQEQHHVKIEEDEIERKAEELRQRVLASAPKTYYPKHVTEIETYSSPYKMTEEPIQFVDFRREKNAKRNAELGEFFLTCFVIALFFIGIYKGKSFLAEKKNVQNSVATQLDSGDQHTAQKEKTIAQPILLTSDSVKNRQDSLLAVQKTAQKIAPARKRQIDSFIRVKPLNTISLSQQEKKEDSQSGPQRSGENPVSRDLVTKRDFIPAVQAVSTTTGNAKEEKKGFLKGLFKKKRNENSDTTAAQH
jgi:hypothetical protein